MDDLVLRTASSTTFDSNVTNPEKGDEMTDYQLFGDAEDRHDFELIATPRASDQGEADQMMSTWTTPGILTTISLVIVC